MKKNTWLSFTRVLYGIFTAATIIAFIIVYKDIDSSIALKFLIGYLFLVLFLLLYVPLITIINSKKLSKAEVRERLVKFLVWFLLLGAVGYGFDYIFRPSKVDLLREFSIALGIAFGISFIDVTFLKKNTM